MFKEPELHEFNEFDINLLQIDEEETPLASKPSFLRPIAAKK